MSTPTLSPVWLPQTDAADYLGITDRTLRRMIDAVGGNEALQPVLERMSRTRNNEEFLSTLSKEA